MPVSHWENADLFNGGTDFEWSREYDLRYSNMKIPISIGKIKSGLFRRISVPDSMK